jgi:hypothetical protein
MVATTLPSMALPPTQLPETDGVLWPIMMGLGLMLTLIGGIIRWK